MATGNGEGPGERAPGERDGKHVEQSGRVGATLQSARKIQTGERRLGPTAGEVGTVSHILVIDDDGSVRSMLRQTLERAGYEVSEAADGDEGIDLYRRRPADLVIMDIIMPQKSGWTAILELKTEFPDVKIIAISGGGKLGPFSYLMIAKRFGARHIFKKPVRKQELLDTIADLLSGKKVDPSTKKRAGRREGEKKSILLVDRDPEHAWQLCDGLTMAGHSVTDTPVSLNALAMIRKRSFNVAIIDLEAIRAGDADLIELLRRSWPHPLIIAMADFDVLAGEEGIVHRRVDHFVGKPVDIDYILDIISPPPAFSGRTEGMDMLEYVQFMLLTKKRTIVEVRAPGREVCELFLDTGSIVHAEYGTEQGEQAFFRSMTLAGGELVNRPWKDPPVRSIDKSGDRLLMEAARIRDGD
jgi:DNA-binding response OmpR family regulator